MRDGTRDAAKPVGRERSERTRLLSGSSTVGRERSERTRLLSGSSTVGREPSTARRDLLRAFGLLAGGATLLPSLRPRAARAAVGAPPRRLLIFYNLQGMLIPYWKPAGPGGGEPTETQFDLVETLAPLRRHKDKLILLSGLDMKSRDVVGGNGNTHQQGEAHSLTPFRMLDVRGGGTSFDQYVAQGLKQNGIVTPVPYLNMKVASIGAATGTSPGTPSYERAGVPVPFHRDPRNAFRTLFPYGQRMDASAAPSKEVEQEKSVLDFIAGELEAVKAKLGRDDRVKLDAHVTAVRDLERRINLASQARAGGACPMLDAGVQTAAADWAGDAEKMSRLAQAAFACNLTRVVFLHIGFPSDASLAYNRNAFDGSNLHGLSHETAEGGELRQNAAAMEVSRRARTMMAEQLAKLLDLLAAVPESDGRSLLDHSAVLWCGDLAEGRHSLRNLKWVLAGSAGGTFRTGRYLSFGAYARRQSDRERGPSHSNLFVSLANAVGVPTETFGVPEACTGELMGLK